MQVFQVVATAVFPPEPKGRPADFRGAAWCAPATASHSFAL